MKEVIALIIFLAFSIMTIYLAVNKKISSILTAIFLSFSIISGIAISNHDFIKKIKWKGIEIETFERKVNDIKKNALDIIKQEVKAHKQSLQDLSIKTEKRKKEIEALTKNTLKYSFFMIDPFTGTASTGGGHGKGGTWASETGLVRLMGKAQGLINDSQYDQALGIATEIDQLFPQFPGALYIRFLAYKGKGNNTEAYEFADKIINQISEFGLSEIRPTGVADAYKFVIKKKFANGKKDEAKEIAKKASEIWQNDKEFLNMTQ